MNGFCHHIGWYDELKASNRSIEVTVNNERPLFQRVIQNDHRIFGHVVV